MVKQAPLKETYKCKQEWRNDSPPYQEGESGEVMVPLTLILEGFHNSAKPPAPTVASPQ